MHHCLNCGIELTKRRQKKYCSNKCQMNFEYKDYIIKWKSGLENGIIGGRVKTTTNQIRRYLFEKYNNRCANCGWSETNKKTGLIPLELEHIDGNFLNNKEDNLTLLCPNCHSLTETYGILNKGNGRRTFETGLKNIEITKHICLDCGIEIRKNSKHQRCPECSLSFRRVVKERPDPLSLASNIMSFGYVKTGKIYGVSDNAIRKWCKSYDMPIKREELVIWLEKNRQSI